MKKKLVNNGQTAILEPARNFSDLSVKLNNAEFDGIEILKEIK